MNAHQDSKVTSTPVIKKFEGMTYLWLKLSSQSLVSLWKILSCDQAIFNIDSSDKKIPAKVSWLKILKSIQFTNLNCGFTS